MASPLQTWLAVCVRIRHCGRAQLGAEAEAAFLLNPAATCILALELLDTFGSCRQLLRRGHADLLHRLANDTAGLVVCRIGRALFQNPLGVEPLTRARRGSHWRQAPRCPCGRRSAGWA